MLKWSCKKQKKFLIKNSIGQKKKQSSGPLLILEMNFSKTEGCWCMAWDISCRTHSIQQTEHMMLEQMTRPLLSILFHR